MIVVVVMVVLLVLVVVMDLPSLSGTSDPHRKGLSSFQKRTMNSLQEGGIQAQNQVLLSGFEALQLQY